jgi:hypothetical protein
VLVSRGLGKVERAVLGLVPERRDRYAYITSAEIAQRLYGHEPTEGQRRSLRRAIRSLAAKDLIDTELYYGPVEHGGHAVMHFVRRPRRRRAKG